MGESIIYCLIKRKKENKKEKYLVEAEESEETLQ